MLRGLKLSKTQIYSKNTDQDSVGHNDATQSRWVTTQMYDELADGKQAQKKLGRVC